MVSENREPAKKEYKVPKLVVYGDIRTLTRAVTSNPTHDRDNPAGPPNKT